MYVRSLSLSLGSPDLTCAAAASPVAQARWALGRALSHPNREGAAAVVALLATKGVAAVAAEARLQEPAWQQSVWKHGQA